MLNGMFKRTGGRVVTTNSPLTPAARVQLPDAALSSLTHATILSGSVKSVATSEHMATAVANYGCKCSTCGSALMV